MYENTIFAENQPVFGRKVEVEFCSAGHSYILVYEMSHDRSKITAQVIKKSRFSSTVRDKNCEGGWMK